MSASNPTTLTGNIVDLPNRRVFPGTLRLADGRIEAVIPAGGPFSTWIVPGFVDAHVHVESSLLVPSEFARLAVIHGTVATVSDPHEIANVLGREGVDFMIANGREVNFHFAFGAPSCVPATPFETAGDTLDPAAVADLLRREDVPYLSEMMNFPGVVNGDADVLAKLETARRLGKPVDGHAPGLRGGGLAQYAAAGISTDHECFQLNEALEKRKHGMKIALREGSAARNFDELAPLLRDHADHCFFCADDKHCDSLLLHHIDELVRRAIRLGNDPLAMLRVASLNPILHYGLPVGLLREGDSADFLEISSLDADFRVLRTFIRGVPVAENGRSLLPGVPVKPVNRFHARQVPVDAFRVRNEPGKTLRVIEAREHQLVTGCLRLSATERDGLAVADPDRDLLKITVVNRYAEAPPAVGFIRNIGLKHGALASSVAHDSHNIVAVGADDESLAAAVNLVMEHRGGLAAVSGDTREILPLPVAGLMSEGDGFAVAAAYTKLEETAKRFGTPLASPFMTLSFMALLVIPSLKLSDKGLFDGDQFRFTDLFGD